MIKFPCTKCPVYIMCKNRLHSTHPTSIFTMCTILHDYIFENINRTESGRVMDRLNIARTFFGFDPIRKG
jgi:hypothetical protein